MGIGIEISKETDEIDSVEYVENYIKEMTTNKNKQADMYLLGFLDENNDSMKTAAQTLLQYKLYICNAPFGSEFITSDNPGFTLLPNNQLLAFGGLSLPFKFIFPLTPKCCLIISHNEIEKNNLLLTKDIHFFNTDKNEVKNINTFTYQLAIEKVFSYSKYILEELPKN